MMLPFLVHAQISDNNPNSIFGLGQLNNPHFMFLRHMGDLGASYRDAYNINTVNPAGLTALRAATFDVGVSTEFSRLSDGNRTNNTFNGSLEYISLAFPTRNPVNELFDRIETDFRHSMAITLQPHSTVGYEITSDNLDDELGVVRRQFSGSGGTTKFVLSNGFQYKDFSVGVNVGYLFGKIRFERDIRFLDVTNAFSLDFENNYSLTGFLWRLGAQYNYVINKAQVALKKGIAPKVLQVGVYGNSSTAFRTESNVVNLLTHQTFPTTVVDTIEVSDGLTGRGRLPAEFGIGANYRSGNKWMIGVDYAFAGWDIYENDANPETLSNASKLSLGGYFRPDYNSYDNYFKRVYYRWGAFFNTDPRSVETEQLTDLGFSVGLGLPFVYQKKISHANLGFTVGQRGAESFIQETYFNISLGFSYNDDEWFIKRKYY